MHGRRRRALAGALGSLAAAGATLTAGPADHAAAPTPAAAQAAASAHAATAPVRAGELLVRPKGGELQRIRLRDGLDPQAIARRLRARPDLFESAGANFVARAAGSRVAAGVTAGAASATAAAAQTTLVPAPVTLPPGALTNGGGATGTLRGWIPDDGIDGVPWTALQWNFAGRFGVNAPEAWEALRRRGRSAEGGRKVKIAVIDSGIAARNAGPYRASPDLPAARILQGYDFVEEDRFPDDLSGHGTHVASTIAGATNNAAGLTGLAYEAELIPVRVLDAKDEGDVVAIARGIRYALRRGANLINLSVDFPVSVTKDDIPEVMSAIEEARRKGVLLIASSGNEGVGEVSLPARSSSVLAVGATTARGCRSSFSNAGEALDLVAPGGGLDHRSEAGGSCRPGEQGPPIAQVTLLRSGDPGTLGVPLDYVGTSMAASHVTGIAALVRASGILGRSPSPELLAAYLVRSTRDLGDPGRDARYGAGLIDAAKATSSAQGRAAARGARRAVAKAARRPSSALPTR